MSLHFPPLINELGCPKIFDMIHFEHGHGKKVKKPFKSTSARNFDIYSEIISKIEDEKIVHDATIYNREKFQRHQFKKRLRKFNYMTYITSDNIVYETTCCSNNKQQIIFVSKNNFRLKDRTIKFLNPLITLNTFFNILYANIEDLISPEILGQLYLNMDCVKLSFIKTINIDSGPQGFPLTTLCCSNTYDTNNSNIQKRFDWIILKNENNSIFFCQLIALLMVEINHEKPIYIYIAVKCDKVKKVISNKYIPFDIGNSKTFQQHI
jgi:hypothetical protein